MDVFKVGLVVPTLNAGSDINNLLDSLKIQTKKFDKILFIDSSSSDDTQNIIMGNNIPLKIINKADFDHGGTRQLGADFMSDMDIIVFMTQDAYLASPTSIEEILRPFSDKEVGMAYGRQLPRPGAEPIEAHARLFNYADTDNVISLENARKFGIKATFCSNSFSAYRAEALRSVGGFPSQTIFGEDVVTAGRFLVAGWKKIYASKAVVFHSHSYNVIQDFKRYFDIGVLHTREAWILQKFGGASGEGVKFVKSELKYLYKNSPALIPSAILRTFLKYGAYKLGRMEHKLPKSWKVHLSMNHRFWR